MFTFDEKLANHIADLTWRYRGHQAKSSIFQHLRIASEFFLGQTFDYAETTLCAGMSTAKRLENGHLQLLPAEIQLREELKALYSEFGIRVKLIVADNWAELEGYSSEIGQIHLEFVRENFVGDYVEVFSWQDFHPEFEIEKFDRQEILSNIPEKIIAKEVSDWFLIYFSLGQEKSEKEIENQLLDMAFLRYIEFPIEQRLWGKGLHLSVERPEDLCFNQRAYPGQKLVKKLRNGYPAVFFCLPDHPENPGIQGY